MNKFLSVLGTVIKIVGQASGFIPMIGRGIPPVSAQPTPPPADKLHQIFDVVVTTEQMFTAAFGQRAKQGSDKLKAATPFVAQLVQEVPLLVGKKIKDEALFTDASTRLTAAIADILNSVGQ